MDGIRIVGVAVLLMVGLVARGQTAVGETNAALPGLTLAEAYARAVAHNEDLAIDAEEWRAAEARYRGARAGRWPELNASGSGEWRDTGEESRADNVYRAGVGARYPIFTGFRTTRVIEGRAAEREALEFDQMRAWQLLYLDVADVFFQVLSEERQLVALDAQMVALDERAQELERRVGLGRARRAELLAAQSQVANAQVLMAQSRGAIAGARELLAFVTGTIVDEVMLVDTSSLPDATLVERFLNSEVERPDIQAAAARLEAARANARAVQSERGVTVAADGHVYAYSDPGSPGDWDLTLQAELPLFDGGMRRAATAEQRAVVRTSELRLAQVQRLAGHDVRAAYAEMVSALGQWSALCDAERLAQANAELQAQDYALGRASNLDALTALAQERLVVRSRVAQEMQAKAALIRLHVAAGATP